MRKEEIPKNPEERTGFQGDGNPLSSIHHQISSKSHIGDRMQTRTPTKISKRKEQENISSTHNQKSEAKKNIQDSRERGQRKPKRGALIPATTQPMWGKLQQSQEPRGTPDKKLWFLLLAWYYCYNFFQSFFPFPMFVEGNQMGRKNSTHIARPNPPNHEHKHRSKHTHGERVPD
jgi:hypothetical protein